MIFELSNLNLNFYFLFNSELDLLPINNFLLSSSIIINKNSKFSSYLAGLIEGDGSIIVPKENIKSYNPYFEIVFHIDDLPLSYVLQSIIGGNLLIKENYCILIIKKKSSVLKIINLINGSMRTPKIEALHRMINWFNLNGNTKLKPLGLDISPILSNSWLSGFIDADGSFYVNWLLDKKGRATSLQYYLRISQRSNYHKLDSIFNISYFNIMNKICKDLSIPLRFRKRLRNNGKIEENYEVRTANYLSNYTILSYLIQYPLFSYKYLHVIAQLKLLKLSKNKEYKNTDGVDRLKELKNINIKNNSLNLNKVIKINSHYEHIAINFPF